MEVEFTVSEFIAVCNQTLEYTYNNISIVGEVSSYKVNQGKWVFFDLKDEESSVGCFMPVWSLRQPLEDGMKVRAFGTPKMTKWGKFSFTVQQIMPVGEGNIKKSFELLKKKLTREGLFDPVKKRPLPEHICKIGVISSTQAAGYADFIKIIGERWGGLEIQVCHTQVQGLVAADQIIRALQYLNEHSDVDIIAIIRGGGSAEDLAVFNDEKLARTIAASKIPTITGIGHEIDESLADLAADVIASTPSNAAEMLTPDRAALKRNISAQLMRVQSAISAELTSATEHNISAVQNIKKSRLFGEIDNYLTRLSSQVSDISRALNSKIDSELTKLSSIYRILDSVNPNLVLAKGYAIIRGEVDIGRELQIETDKSVITAEVKTIEKRRHHDN